MFAISSSPHNKGCLCRFEQELGCKHSSGAVASNANDVDANLLTSSRSASTKATPREGW